MSLNHTEVCQICASKSGKKIKIFLQIKVDENKKNGVNIDNFGDFLEKIKKLKKNKCKN
mgnify:CR=1 FL=1